MAILDETKKELRITNTAYDDEVANLIAECKIDLAESGAENTDDTDPLVKRAIFLYAKANFGMANPDADKYQKRYDRLVIKLSLSDEYQTGGA